MTTQRRRRAAPGARVTDQWAQYIRGRVTLSAANTFTQVTVNLPVVVSQGLVLEAYEVEWSIGQPAAGDLSATDDAASQSVQLTKASQTAILALDNPSIIASYQTSYISPAARTAEKAPVIEVPLNGALIHQWGQPILLPFEQIFFGANAAGIAAANVYIFRVSYRTVRLATRQLPELIQAVT